MEKAFKLDAIDALSEPEIFETELHGLNVGGYLRQASADLMFLGGRPGNGKTLLALQIAYTISKYSTALFFSLEMTKEQLKARLSKDRAFSSRNSELYIYSAPAISIERLVDVATEQHAITPLGIIVIDYIQIIQTQGRTKAEEVGAAVMRLKELALTLGVPILCLAQLNRNIEARSSVSEFAQPQMSDFADSAEIEKFADCCLMLHRIPKADDVTKVYCTKNRHGRKHDFCLRLNRTSLRFEDHLEE